MYVMTKTTGKRISIYGWMQECNSAPKACKECVWYKACLKEEERRQSHQEQSILAN